MSRLIAALAGAAATAGALVVAWVAASHLVGNPLALAITLLIAACYGGGVVELWRFHQATQGLQRALRSLGAAGADGAEGAEGAHAAAPATLNDWLAQVPAALQAAVRQRVEAGHGMLPGPGLTPYLAGLLVLLGMLGTFLGMVVTLNGTGLALERATDVQTMRDSLAAPVRGLGLAFGTSVAGVASSAMLGLVSALCRRARAAAALALEDEIAGALRVFTRAHRQQEEHQEAQRRAEAAQRLQQAAYALQQRQAEQQAAQQAQQAEQLPLMVASLQALTAQVARQLQQGMSEGARLTDATLATLQPAVAATMGGITRETAALHTHITAHLQQQLDGMRQGFETQASGWLASAGAQMQAQTAALLASLQETLARQQAQQAAAEEARVAASTSALAQVARQVVEHNVEQMAARLQQSAAQLGAQLEAQAGRTIEEVTQLARSAGEAPRAAAELMAQLRGQFSASLVQDNALLEERSRIMATLNSLLGAVQHTSTAQKAAIDELVASSARWLEEAGTRLSEKADAETARLEAVSAQLTASAVEVASLGEAFGGAVHDFGHSSQQLLTHLQRLDEHLEKAATRSDEQLAYYVAQAREVIDLSLLSQKQIIDDLQRLARRPDRPDGHAAPAVPGAPASMPA